ncbi:MAG: DNA replication/repair protein RecF [Candidatus Moraniibacteriota bacterium]|nr:MAG: DNA replication/repair protein RecF [Candidatus Moranbacteria bacterium]
MYLERLSLTNYRNYTKQSFRFNRKVIIRAPNGSGKSNLLEAIQLLATGTSERAGKIEEMIKFDAEVASVVGVVANVDGSYTELSVILTRGMVAGKKAPKRRYLVDGIARTKSVFVSRLVTMMFAPGDMRLIEGSRERRRNYMDLTLSVAHPEYVRALGAYEATLLRRNRLLDNIREGRSRVSELSYWDQSLIKNGEIVKRYREDYLRYLSEEVEVSYDKYQIDYVASIVSPAKLAEHLQAEIALGYTLVGPHKDDFRVMTRVDKDLKVFGSRGEQRLGVLFLKTGAMQYLTNKLKVKPIILLDDVFSELDEVHRSEILSLQNEGQMIITTAETNLGIGLPEFEEVGLESLGFR